MKLVSIVGARPQFVKAAAVSRVIRRRINETLVHTGQHYDNNMSDVFFNELSIPHPNYNLGVGSGSHAEQTAKMMVEIEKVLDKEIPDAVLVYGDTNSTLAGALVAVKKHIPIIHVEAGLRSFNMKMPEEINRILTDRVSSVLYCPTQTAVENLQSEGITKNVFDIGDVMCDAIKFYSGEFLQSNAEEYIDRIIPITHSTVKLAQHWYIATIHRAENTDDILKIENILNALEQLAFPVIFPVHPRTKKMVMQLLDKNHYLNILFCEPMSYKTMLYFLKHAEKAITDSGGLQKECYMLKTPCVTVRDQTEWIETLIGSWNILAKPITDDIVEKVNNTVIDKNLHKSYYGNGDAAEKILDTLLRGII